MKDNPANAPQLLLNISGGAGTGKSYWLNTVKRYSRDQDMHQDFITTAAPSGTAAFLIGGETLHSLLSITVGKNMEKELSPGRLVMLQKRFKNVGILVIDEKSMVGHKMFTIIDQRLRQVRPENKEKPFGGLSVVLLGDWKQLPPVLDTALYRKDTKKKHGFHLFRLFTKVIKFKKVQRQDGDAQASFRQELCGLGDGTFSPEDWRKWSTRSLDLLPPAEREDFINNGILACALKIDMLAHNIGRVKAIGHPIAFINSVNTKGPAASEIGDKETGLPKNLIICKKTIFRLTSILWTEAGLTNGSVGVVQYILYAEGSSPPELPVAVVATFEAYTGPPFLPHVPKSVVVCPVQRQFYHGGSAHKRTMLPMILGYALSIHKLQGATCGKVILNPGPKEFAPGLLLVGATRVKSFESLAFHPFPNFERFQQAFKGKAFQKRTEEEGREVELEERTVQEYQAINSMMKMSFQQ